MLAHLDLLGIDPESTEHHSVLGEVAREAAALRSPAGTHTNVVTLLGEVPDTRGRTVSLLVERADKGNLEQ